MAQYDGSIRINTQIDTQGVEKGVKAIADILTRAARDISKVYSGVDKSFDSNTDSAKNATESVKELDENLKNTAESVDNLNRKTVDIKITRHDDINPDELVPDVPREEPMDTRARVRDLEGLLRLTGEIKDEEQQLAQTKKNTLALDQQAIELGEIKKRLSQKMTELQKEHQESLESLRGVNDLVQPLDAAKTSLLYILRILKAGMPEAGKAIKSNVTHPLQTLKSVAVGIAKSFSGSISVIKETGKAISAVAKGASKAFSTIASITRGVGKVASTLDSLLKKATSSMVSLIKKTTSSMSSFRKSAKDSNNVLQTGFKTILKYGLGIRSLYILVNKIRAAIKEGFGNLYTEVDEFKTSVDGLKASALTLKNAFAAAFRPLVEIAIPYIQKIVDYMTSLLNKLGQLVAALTGQKTYTKAIQQTADAFKEEAEATEEAKEATEGYLGPLDELNKYSDGSSKGADSSNGIEEIKAPMFEEVPIDQYYLGLAENVKDAFSKFFEPIKKAWDTEGSLVMDSWSSALEEVQELIKSVGSDFLEVWQQDETVKIFEDLLHIISDIGLVVSNLARNFREAWEENESGKKILEAIRDIIGVVVSNIRHAADATVEWSKDLDFGPLLTAIQAYLESLIPVFEALSGIMTDFYEMVLLPLAKWALEEGLPMLLQVLTDFNEKVDWETLRANMARFWEHLEPFAETVGEGLIIFIGRLSDVLANFVNSPTFENFLVMIENWMDSVSPEDVANAIEKLAVAIIVIKGATIGFSAVSSVLPIFKSLATVLGLFGPVGIAVGALALAGFLSKTIEDVDMAKVGEAVGNALEKVIELIGKLLGETNWLMLGQKAIDFIAGIDWGSLLTTLLENIVKILGNLIGGAIALHIVLAKAIGTFIINGVDSSKEYFSKKIEECGGEIGDGIKKGIVDGLASIGRWIKEHIFQPFIDGFKDAFGIHSPSTVMIEMAAYIISGLLEGLTSNIGSVLDWLKNIPDWFKDKFDDAYENAKDAFSGAEKFFSGIWEGIQNAFGNITDWFKDKFSAAWRAVKDVFSAGGEVFSGIKDGILDDLKNVINTLIDGINTVLAVPLNGINSALDMIRSVDILGHQPFSWLPSIEVPQIPHLAQGTVVPPNKEFMAVLGDNKREPEVVSPLSTIEQAVKNAISSTETNRNSGGGNIVIQLVVEKKVLGQTTVEWAKIQQMATGRNPLMLGNA